MASNNQTKMQGGRGNSKNIVKPPVKANVKAQTKPMKNFKGKR